ncbi:MAG: ABC transporter ATP-binding protein [Bdellovibrionaceae bacterium]|nr:ABC transporter ATP-binding protein [Pseudobdellovibrionaceae bacterium]
MIEVENLKKSFKQSENAIEILKNLNLNVKKGEKVGILGQSGSGKSTFLSLMSGLDAPDSGDIRINGVSTTKLSEKDWTDFRAKNISIVFQQYHLVGHLTAAENVMLPLEILGVDEKQAQTKALTLLEEVGLKNRVHHFPHQLSGGESQRVAIARALITTPNLLLADEPSGNLDQETGQKVMSLFFDITSKYQTTTLLVTHNEQLASRCDVVYKLSQGKFEKL